MTKGGHQNEAMTNNQLVFMGDLRGQKVRDSLGQEMHSF